MNDLPAFPETDSKTFSCNIIPSLRAALDAYGATSVLCGNSTHFQSTRDVDSGWGCGYRNIQVSLYNTLF